MVSALSIGFMMFSGIVSFLLPLGLTIYLYKREKIQLKAVLIGALVFFVFQMLLRIPIITFLSEMSWYQQMAKWRGLVGIVALPLFLALTAGLFEEIGRFLGFKYFLRDHLLWKNGVALGIGHGGIEAILLVGLGNLTNIIYSLMINNGKFDTQIAPGLPEGTAEFIKYSLINTPSIMFLVGGVERIMTMIIQIAFSLIVLYGVAKKRFSYVLYAILLHTLVDIPAALYQREVLGLFITEVIVFLLAILSLVYIVRARSFFDQRAKP